MSDAEQMPIIKIAVVGPARVGKTSVINAVLEQGKAALSGTPATLVPLGQTKGKLDQIRNQLEGAIQSGSFDAQGINSSNDRSIYKLRMEAGGSQAELHFVDYPGRWMSQSEESPAYESTWRECQDFINDSPVLLVPVDSAVLMEARTATEKANAAVILHIAGVRDVAEAWAKRRQEKAGGGEPRVMVLVPLKCESYLNDNGGNRDDGKRLYLLVDQYYRRVIEVVQTDCPSVRILYAPIDTYGCTTLISSRFTNGDAVPDFTARYRFRSRDPRIQPKGADTLLGVIAKEVVEYATALAATVSTASDQAHQKAATEAMPDGLTQKIWWWLNGEGKRRRQIAEQAANESGGRRAQLDSWYAVMKHFAQVKPAGRSAWIKDQ